MVLLYAESNNHKCVVHRHRIDSVYSLQLNKIKMGSLTNGGLLDVLLYFYTAM